MPRSSEITDSKPFAQNHENPFKDNRHQSVSGASNVNNYNGGPLYGVSERDNWLLAKDDATADDHGESQI